MLPFETPEDVSQPTPDCVSPASVSGTRECCCRPARGELFLNTKLSPRQDTATTTAVLRHEPQPLPRKAGCHSQWLPLGTAKSLPGKYPNKRKKNGGGGGRKVTTPPPKKDFVWRQKKKEWGGRGSLCCGPGPSRGEAASWRPQAPPPFPLLSRRQTKTKNQGFKWLKSSKGRKKGRGHIINLTYQANARSSKHNTGSRLLIDL